MINSNTSSIHAASRGISQSATSISQARNTFKGIVADLAKRPLKPLGVQQHAGSTIRSLAQQVCGDIAAT